jgi:hypothetical protein
MTLALELLSKDTSLFSEREDVSNMQLSLYSLLVVAACGQAPAEHRTASFVIYADSPAAAKLIGEFAETSRKELAEQWLGDQEAVTWTTPCHLHVSLNLARVGGFTEVSYAKGKVRVQKVEIEGPLDRVLTGLLPHELTHVLFANYFGAQPPRWADEGGALLSEDEAQGERQSKFFRRMLAEDKCFPLGRFFALGKYPDDVPCLYAQAHSVARFLVDAKGRKAFLAFVKNGVESGWDDAARKHYGYTNVEQLEKAWLTWADKQAVASTAVSDAGRRERTVSANLHSEGSLRLTDPDSSRRSVFFGIGNRSR